MNGGEFERFKARCVCKGYTQTYNVDFHETYSPVVNFTVVRIFFCYVAHHDLELYKLDIKNAFVQSELTDRVFVWPIPGFAPEQSDESDFNVVLKLLRSWYGSVFVF